MQTTMLPPTETRTSRRLPRWSCPSDWFSLKGHASFLPSLALEELQRSTGLHAVRQVRKLLLRLVESLELPANPLDQVRISPGTLCCRASA
jgi:hypothetical protein